MKNYFFSQNMTENNDYNIDENLFRVSKSSVEKETSIYCYGCSNTFGTGLKYEETWPFKLSLKLNKGVKNFGIIGGSMDQITRIIFTTLNNSKQNNNLPSEFFCLFPDIFRYNLFFDDANMKPFCHSYGDKIYNDFYKKFLKSMENDSFLTASTSKEYLYFSYNTCLNAFMSFVKDFKFIDTIAKLYSIKWWWSTWDPMLLKLDNSILLKFLGSNTFLTEKTQKTSLEFYKDKARDNLHIGPLYCNYISDKFFGLVT